MNDLKSKDMRAKQMRGESERPRDARTGDNTQDSTAAARRSPASTRGIRLSVENHDRDIAGMRYVYPVLSRRAGGISLGINLNPNNACNWACVYCQVPGLTLGGPPPIDLFLLREELVLMLKRIQDGACLVDGGKPESAKLVDIAFSGNGEPTSAAEFTEAVGVVADLLNETGLSGKIPVRLISNGSLVRKAAVSKGLRALAAIEGEVWFKVDRASADGIEAVNKARRDPERMLEDLQHCARLVPTWVQTCWFGDMNGPPSEAEVESYIAFIKRAKRDLVGVHLYGLARPSMQAGANTLKRLEEVELNAFAERIKATGLRVCVSP